MRWLRRALVGDAGVFVALRAVPYGWTKSNPAVRADAPWPDASSASLARVSCYACHSNETDWPAYSYVAPASWLVRRDVDVDRDELNFSEWGEDSDADDAAEAIADGSMPPSRYTLLHPGARLSDAERQLLIEALETMEDAEDDDDDSGRDGRGEDRDGD